MSFLILALPRSRTAWLSHYLNYPPRRVGHDILVECKSVGDFIDSFESGMWGTVETGGMWGARLYRKFLPHIKIVTIHRSPDEVLRSFRKLNVKVDLDWLEKANDQLEICSRLPGAERFDFEDLDDSKVCRFLFEYCLELPFDEGWYESHEQIDIQIDMKERLEQLARNQEDLKVLKNEVMEISRKVGAQWLM